MARLPRSEIRVVERPRDDGDRVSSVRALHLLEVVGGDGSRPGCGAIGQVVLGCADVEVDVLGPVSGQGRPDHVPHQHRVVPVVRLQDEHDRASRRHMGGVQVRRHGGGLVDLFGIDP